jgi:hypothetical protein
VLLETFLDIHIVGGFPDFIEPQFPVPCPKRAHRTLRFNTMSTRAHRTLRFNTMSRRNHRTLIFNTMSRRNRRTLGV